MNRHVKGLRCIRDIMTHNPGRIDYVLLYISPFGRVLRITPEPEQYQHFFVTLKYRIGQETDGFGILALRAKPFRILVSVVRDRFEALRAIDINKVVGRVLARQGRQPASGVAPAVRLRSEV